MIYVTGDTHADFRRFSTENFPEQKEMTRDDMVLIAGDFGGIWYPGAPFPLISERDRLKGLKHEKQILEWFASKKCTFCFVLGNHENWNRYDSDEFPVEEFRGGMVHRLAENVFHLMSGYVFDFDGYTVYAFGGAASHDISEGILDRKDYRSDLAFKAAYRKWKKFKTFFRVKDFSWWPRESRPTEEEISRGWENLAARGNKVDLVLTHCLPHSVISNVSSFEVPEDPVTVYFDELADRIEFKSWISGHYHLNASLSETYHVLYKQIVRIR